MENREEKKQAIDYTYSKNKYINSNKIKFEKSFLIRRWINRILTLIAFVVTVIVLAIMIKHYSKPMVRINNEKFYYDSKTPLDIGYNIAFGTEKTKLDFLYFIMGDKNVMKGEVTALPQGLIVYNRKQRKLNQDEYAVKCVTGGCEEDKIYIINKNNIYGSLRDE